MEAIDDNSLLQRYVISDENASAEQAEAEPSQMIVARTDYHASATTAELVCHSRGSTNILVTPSSHCG
jgi:hypothetical protein